MKLITPEIVYHNIDPIYTCDIQSKSEDFIRLATGGFDCAVRLWKLNCNYSPVKDFLPVEIVATLKRHEKRVNIVRWSPSGNILASAGDDGIIILWQKSFNEKEQKIDNDDDVNLENWTPRCLRRHFQDVYDLSWSMNENHLISGSIDCCAILWNLKNPNKVIILKDHKQFVQGVAWDPLDNVVITQSTDRTMRVYRASTRTCIYKVWKSGETKLFQDGSWKYFFRRLEFSPDGKLLVTPAGYYDMKKNVDENKDIYAAPNNNDTHAAHIFVRHNLSKVAVTIPTGKHAVIGIRFNPVRFTLNHKANNSVFKLPYRWIFCLVLDNGILVYDTEQCTPIAKIFNIHCLSINDASWSPDGHCLVVSSTDGYCSFVYFDTYELGQPYTLVTKPCIVASSNNNGTVTNAKYPLKTIENVMGPDEAKRNIESNNSQNLPILKLDRTEILRGVIPANETIIDVPSDNECCDIIADNKNNHENNIITLTDEEDHVNTISTCDRSRSQKRHTSMILTTEIKNNHNAEPVTKKRRLTLTMLP